MIIGELISYNELDNKNNIFNIYSNRKKENKINSFYFNDDENEDFFINNKKIICKYDKKNIIKTNRNFNYEKNFEINYKKIMDKLNNNLGIIKKNNSFSSTNNKDTSSYYLNKNITFNNYSNNKYTGRNFQKYMEKKRNSILSKINNNFESKGYIKEKTSVFPVNPFNL